MLQLASLLGEEAAAELEALAARQVPLPLEHVRTKLLNQYQEYRRRSTVATLRKKRRAPLFPLRRCLNIADEGVAVVDQRVTRERERRVRDHLRYTVEALVLEYATSDRGIEIRQIASGFRMGTKPEYHDAVRGFVKSLKPALKLTLQALETLAVVAYKQPVTAAEISEIRGVDSAGVAGWVDGA